MFGPEIIGWIGGTALAFCGVPQAWKSYKDGHSEGLSMGFIILWLVGELFGLAYILPSNSLPLYFNYGGNLVLVLVILRYKIWPNNVKGC